MNRVILWHNFSLFIGVNPVTIRTHSHPSIQLVVATSASFKSKNADGMWEEKRGLLIAPNYHHECDARNVEIMSMEIDTESSLGEWIMKYYMAEHKVIEYPSAAIPALNLEKWFHFAEQENWTALSALIFNYFNFKDSSVHRDEDERITRVVNYIKQNIHTEITTSVLTNTANLSESRLLHLFKEEKGLPIRNYILWYRLKVALSAILAGQSLTAAAYNAGFADQSHMTKTVIKMVGISPSVIVKNSKFIQVSFSE